MIPSNQLARLVDAFVEGAKALNRLGLAVERRNEIDSERLALQQESHEAAVERAKKGGDVLHFGNIVVNQPEIPDAPSDIPGPVG